jgi:anti-sigma B factor antagonist
MNFTNEVIDGTVVFHINEERLDAHNSADLKLEFQKIFESGSQHLLVDLKDVRFIDSSGLGALVSGFKNATSSHGSLRLASLQPQVKSMFELTRLHRVFEIYQTVADAFGK